MNLNKFPPVYKAELDKRTQQQLLAETDHSAEAQRSMRATSAPKPDGGLITFCGGVIGCAIGFFTCVSNCNGETFGEVFGPWILLTIAGLAVGGILAAIINKQYEENAQEIASQISSEENHSQVSREKILTDAENEYERYVLSFESVAQSMSVQFAESQLAVEVVEWMTNGFIKTIDAADRRSHIENIYIPFNFNIYANKITCNLGTFDFEIKRCRNLNNPLEQTALARAIASTIQLNITMKYPQDISGTNIVINTGYSYGEDHVSTNVVYTANNGNYRAVRDWN